MLRRKVVRMLLNLMQPQNKPAKTGYNKVLTEQHKENKMLNKPQAKVQENPAAKEVPKEAARVQAKALGLERVEAEKVVKEKVQEMEKAKVETHPLILEVPLICPVMMAIQEHPLML